MSGESRLAPLREVGNGGSREGQDGIRFIHRNQKLAIKKIIVKRVKWKIFCEICSKTANLLHFLYFLAFGIQKL